ncbi:hypothetical protein Tco_1538407 [Tanacetum coccineum]
MWEETMRDGGNRGKGGMRGERGREQGKAEMGMCGRKQWQTCGDGNGGERVGEWGEKGGMNERANIARCAGNTPLDDDRSQSYLLECLEDLKVVTERKKFDALTVETFGVRIEKLIRMIEEKIKNTRGVRVSRLEKRKERKECLQGGAYVRMLGDKKYIGYSGVRECKLSHVGIIWEGLCEEEFKHKDGFEDEV